MRFNHLTIGLAMAAAGLVPVAANAQGTESKIACIKGRLGKAVSPDLLTALSLKGLKAESAEEKEAFKQITIRTNNCQRDNRWNAKQKGFALEWFVGRNLQLHAIEKLAPFGVRVPQLLSALGSLDNAAFEAVAAGDMKGETYRAVFQKLVESGATIDKAPAAQASDIANTIVIGLVGTARMQRAMEGFG
jgi:hypothetical protein